MIQLFLCQPHVVTGPTQVTACLHKFQQTGMFRVIFMS